MLDRHYTPSETARELASLFDGYDTSSCADSSCGDGSLLLAAASMFHGVHCVGIDADDAAIRRLKRRFPDWSLLCGDFLTLRTQRRVQEFARQRRIDILCLNPPFSMGDAKGIDLVLNDASLRCSVAMAHILRAVDCLSPENGIAAIVPESLMYSQRDSAARDFLDQRFDAFVSKGLKNTTFRGVRANALLVRWLRRTRSSTSYSKMSRARYNIDWPEFRIERGGLPVFEAKTDRNGIPFVHTTHLRSLVSDFPVVDRCVRGIARGVISGHCVLLPRVGTPDKDFIRPLYFPEAVQLSDCVFALRCESRGIAIVLADLLKQRSARLRRLYTGTGARYITLSILEEFFGRVPRDSSPV